MLVLMAKEYQQLGINKEMTESSMNSGDSAGQYDETSLVSKASYMQVLHVSGDKTCHV